MSALAVAPQRTAPHPRVRVLRFAGAFDRRAGWVLQQTVTRLIADRSERNATDVHLDLRRVTTLDDGGVHALDAAFAALAGAERSFRIAPPAATPAFRAFLRAAIDGRFGWARGSEPARV